jgi:hypothetical protein
MGRLGISVALINIFFAAIEAWTAAGPVSPFSPDDSRLQGSGMTNKAECYSHSAIARRITQAHVNRIGCG